MKEKIKKPFYKRWWFWVLAVVVVVGFFGNDSEEASEPVTKEAKEEVEKKEEPKKEEPKELTIDEKVKKAVIDAVKDETNMDKKRIVSVVIENGIAKVGLNADENLTTNLTKDSMFINSIDVFEQLDKVDDLNGYDLSWYMTLVDVKGNKSDDVVIKIILERDHGITWENFNFNNFDKVSTSLFVHPAYQK